MIADGMRKATFGMVMESTTNTVVDTIAFVIQVSYTSSKERMKAVMLHFVDKALLDFTYQVCLDMLLICNIDKLAGLDNLLDALAQECSTE